MKFRMSLLFEYAYLLSKLELMHSKHQTKRTTESVEKSIGNSHTCTGIRISEEVSKLFPVIILHCIIARLFRIDLLVFEYRIHCTKVTADLLTNLAYANAF